MPGAERSSKWKPKAKVMDIVKTMIQRNAEEFSKRAGFKSFFVDFLEESKVATS